MAKVSLLLALFALASPALSTRNAKFLGLSSIFGGSEEEKTEHPPIPDLSEHAVWKVHKYSGVMLHPVSYPTHAGSALPPPSSNYPEETYGLPAPTYGVPADSGFAGAGFTGTTSEAAAPAEPSASEVSMGLDALGALASILPDSRTSSIISEISGTSEPQQETSNSPGILRSTLNSLLKMKGNIGSAISGLAAGKTAALNTFSGNSGIGGGDHTGLLLNLASQYPQLASLLSTETAPTSHPLPKLPSLPELPIIPGIDKIPKLPKIPKVEIPETYPTPAPYPSPAAYAPPELPTTYGAPPTTFEIPPPVETTYGAPSGPYPPPSPIPEPEPRPSPYPPALPQSTYGAPEITEHTFGSSQSFQPFPEYGFPPVPYSEYGHPPDVTPYSASQTVPKQPAQVYSSPQASTYQVSSLAGQFPEATSSNLLPPTEGIYSGPQYSTGSSLKTNGPYPAPVEQPAQNYGPPPANNYPSSAGSSAYSPPKEGIYPGPVSQSTGSSQGTVGPYPAPVDQPAQNYGPPPANNYPSSAGSSAYSPPKEGIYPGPVSQSTGSSQGTVGPYPAPVDQPDQNYGPPPANNYPSSAGSSAYSPPKEGIYPGPVSQSAGSSMETVGPYPAPVDQTGPTNSPPTASNYPSSAESSAYTPPQDGIYPGPESQSIDSSLETVGPYPAPVDKPQENYGPPPSNSYQGSAESSGYTSPHEGIYPGPQSQSTGSSLETVGAYPSPVEQPGQSYGPPSTPVYPAPVVEPVETYGTPTHHQSSAEVASQSNTYPPPSPYPAATGLTPPHHTTYIATPAHPGITKVIFPNHRSDKDSYLRNRPGPDSPNYVPPVLDAISQQLARNSDASQEAFIDESGFKPSNFRMTSFFPMDQDYLPPFVHYKEDMKKEESSNKEASIAIPEAKEEAASASPISAPEVAKKENQKMMDFPVSAMNAAFSDRFRGRIHVAPGEVTIHTAMKVKS